MSAVQDQTLLIRGAGVITMDSTLGDFVTGDVLISNGRIAQVAARIDAPDGAELIDGSALIAMPGFIDAHRHQWQGLLRNALPVEDVDAYFKRVNLGLATVYSPEDAYLGTLVSALGALDAGITTVFDWSHIQTTPAHSDAVIAALRESGIRAVFGFGMPGRRDMGHAWPQDLLRLQRDQFGSATGLVTLALATRGPEYGADETVRADFSMARDAGLIVSVHCAINGNRSTGQIERFGREGLLGPHVNLVHCNNLTATEWKIIADTGTSVCITPSSEMQMGQGIPPIQPALDVGIRPGLGIDVETSVPGDMWTQMRIVYALQRMNAAQLHYAGISSPRAMDLQDILECATTGGARCAGLADRVGTLTPGKDADVILLRADLLNVLPVNDLRGAVVTNMDARNVDSVFVAGQPVKRGGRMLDIDVPALARRLYAGRDRLFAAAEQPLHSPVARL